MTNKNNNTNNTNAFFNGKYMPINEVKISPFDRGFLLGDSIYEVVPVYDGKTLGGAQHFQRLMDGLNAIAIESPYTLSDWEGICAPVVLPNQQAQLLYIQITRGAQQTRNHRFPIETSPTVLIFSIPFSPPIDINYQGCAAHLQTDLRWQRCDIKSTSLIANVLAYQQLHSDGASNDEALLVRDALVVEAPSSNLFMVKNTVIFTPPTDNILSGVTRGLILEIAKKLAIEVQEQAPDVQMLMQADEIWVSNSMEELKPIISVDGQPIGPGVPGEIWKQVFTAYQLLKG
ncbi:MAG: D-alanine transaminase [Osedax symbiont Rs2]|nr:MAG: D-alanine transaminase [Osedax symbiont Rs2]